MGLLDDDTSLLGGVVAQRPSPNPKKRRAGMRRYERALNQKAREELLKTGKKYVKPTAPPVRTTDAPGATVGKGTTTAAPTVLTSPTGRGLPAVPTAGGATIPVRKPNEIAPLAPPRAPAPTSSPARPPQPAPIAVGGSRYRGGLAGLLGEVFQTDLPGEQPAPADVPINPAGNATTGTDQFGVPAGWVPQNAAWVSRDLWAGRSPWTVQGVPVAFRIAVPAVDLSAILSWPQYNEVADRTPMKLRAFAQPGDSQRDIALYQLDDLHWDQHAPMPNRVMRLYSRALELAAGAPPLVSTGAGAGQVAFDLSAAEIPTEMIFSDGWNDAGGISPPDMGWVRLPSDFWRVDLSSGEPEFFDPYHPVPIDLLSLYVAKIVPDGQPADFWDRVGNILGLDRFIRPGEYNRPVYIGMIRPTGLDVQHPGRGSITVYLQDDAERAASLPPIVAKLPLPAPTAPTPPATPAPATDPATGLPIDPATGLPYDPASGYYYDATTGQYYPPGGAGYPYAPQDQGPLDRIEQPGDLTPGGFAPSGGGSFVPDAGSFIEQPQFYAPAPQYAPQYTAPADELTAMVAQLGPDDLLLVLEQLGDDAESINLVLVRCSAEQLEQLAALIGVGAAAPAPEITPEDFATPEGF